MCKVSNHLALMVHLVGRNGHNVTPPTSKLHRIFSSKALHFAESFHRLDSSCMVSKVFCMIEMSCTAKFNEWQKQCM